MQKAKKLILEYIQRIPQFSRSFPLGDSYFSIGINHRIKRKKPSQNSASGIHGPFFKILELGWVNCPRRARKITEEVQCSQSVVSDSLLPHGLQHTSPPCPSPTPGVYPNSCPFSQWCHPTISSSVVPFSSSFNLSHIRVFSNKTVLCIRWLEYWSFSFSISHSNEHSGLISFRIDWFDLLAVHRTLKSLLQHHSSKASILWCSAFFIAQHSHLYMTTGKTIALTRWTLCW